MMTKEQVTNIGRAFGCAALGAGLGTVLFFTVSSGLHRSTNNGFLHSLFNPYDYVSVEKKPSQADSRPLMATILGLK